MSFYDELEIIGLGFKRIGKNVEISRKTSFYGVSYIEISDDVCIDVFCVILAGEGGFYAGKNVHIAVYSSIISRGK